MKPLRVIKEGCLTSQGLPIIVKANGHLAATMASHDLQLAKTLAAGPELLECLRTLVTAMKEDLPHFTFERWPEVQDATTLIHKLDK